MLELLRPAAVLLAGFTLLTGAAYPLIVWGAAQAAFPAQANGSLLQADDRVIGSKLVGQPFDDLRYFWGRPSATSSHPYDARASGGSNLGPSNPLLLDCVRERIAALRAAHPDQVASPVPVDLVTASASGLDPHVSPAGALYQVRRVARARRLPEHRLRELVKRHIEARAFGVLGESRVNVVELNLALDALARTPVERAKLAGTRE